jgi:hypothetical protein
MQILINFTQSKFDGAKGSGIKFVNSTTVKDYLSSIVGDGKNVITTSFIKFIGKLLDNRRHKKFVEKTIYGFDNSGSWAVEAAKIISIR